MVTYLGESDNFPVGKNTCSKSTTRTEEQYLQCCFCNFIVDMKQVCHRDVVSENLWFHLKLFLNPLRPNSGQIKKNNLNFLFSHFFVLPQNVL